MNDQCVLPVCALMPRYEYIFAFLAFHKFLIAFSLETKLFENMLVCVITEARIGVLIVCVWI